MSQFEKQRLIFLKSLSSSVNEVNTVTKLKILTKANTIMQVGCYCSSSFH